MQVMDGPNHSPLTCSCRLTVSVLLPVVVKTMFAELC